VLRSDLILGVYGYTTVVIKCLCAFSCLAMVFISVDLLEDFPGAGAVPGLRQTGHLNAFHLTSNSR
jgi:hypothetical protein